MKRTDNIETEYFTWLYRQVGAVSDPNPAHSHIILAEALHREDFRWHIHNDDNREADAIELRSEFIDETGLQPTSSFMDERASVFEVLIALSRRMDYEISGGDDPDGPLEFFWIMIANLGLFSYTDEVYLGEVGIRDEVESILDTFLSRSYNFDGDGGLFPLRNPRKDQRKTEIWYQMSAYILENYDTTSL